MGKRRGRLVLPPDEYRKLLLTIFKRDNHRCRACPRRVELHGHHLIFRSHQGDDIESNLLSLCHNCHEAVHQRFLLILPVEEGQPLDANKPLKFIALGGWKPGERIRRHR